MISFETVAATVVCGCTGCCRSVIVLLNTLHVCFLETLGKSVIACPVSNNKLRWNEHKSDWLKRYASNYPETNHIVSSLLLHYPTSWNACLLRNVSVLSANPRQLFTTDMNIYEKMKRGKEEQPVTWYISNISSALQFRIVSVMCCQVNLFYTWRTQLWCFSCILESFKPSVLECSLSLGPLC